MGLMNSQLRGKQHRLEAVVTGDSYRPDSSGPRETANRGLPGISILRWEQALARKKAEVGGEGEGAGDKEEGCGGVCGGCACFSGHSALSV